MKKLKERITIVGLIVVILFLVWKSCEQNAQLSNFENQMSKFDIGEQKFKKIIDADSNLILEQQQIILTQKQALNNNLIEINRLKKIQSQVKIVSKVKIDSVFIPFHDTLYIDTSNNKNNALNSFIRVPKTFSMNNEFYSFDGTILKKGLILDSVRFDNQMTLTFGFKSVGLFKKPEPVLDIMYKNPYIQTSSLNNIVIKNELKWYEKKPFFIGIGFVGGILTGNFINR